MAVVAGLAGPGLSRDRVAHHTSVITAALGTEVPAAVPTSTLQSLARRSGQPGPFVQQFSNCSAQQIPQLGGMMALLERLGQEEGLRASLAESSESAGGNQYSSQPVPALSPDFKTLRERLLKEVVSSSAAAAQLERPRSPPPFAHRPNLTANFLLEGVQQPTGRRRTALAGVPAASQESLLLEELLYTLVGNQGEHITPCRAGNPASLSFTLDPDMDPSLAALVQRLLPLAQHYSAVVAWCEAVRPKDGLVNQALAAGVEQLVLDYTKLVCQLEQRLARAELTLHSLHHALQSSKQCMKLLAGLVQDVTARQATGGATLSILHAKQLHCASHPKSEKVIQFLTELAAKPFFETMSAWLHRGVIVDPGRDFFVEDHEVVDRACLPTEYNDDYWEKRYGLRLDQLPTFLARYADTVLRTGKYLNVIQQCDKTAKWRPIVPLQYLQNPEHYSEIFTEAHQFASTNLLQLLINDRDLIGHLKSVKKYFLMEQGDFICQFLDLCEPELSQSVDCVEPARLESLLEMAARTSTANYDAYKDNLCVALLPYDLEFQMGKIMAIDTADEGEFQQCDTSLLSGMDAFAFGYQVEWPISLVLNHKALAQYQMLFRHFFYCKHIERLLSAVWISNKQTKFLPSKEFKVGAYKKCLKQVFISQYSRFITLHSGCDRRC